MEPILSFNAAKAVVRTPSPRFKTTSQPVLRVFMPEKPILKYPYIIYYGPKTPLYCSKYMIYDIIILSTRTPQLVRFWFRVSGD